MKSNHLKTPFAVSLALHGVAIFMAAAFLTGRSPHLREITPIEIVEAAKETPAQAPVQKASFVHGKTVKKTPVKKEEPVRAPQHDEPVLPNTAEKEEAAAALYPTATPHETAAHQAVEIKTENPAAQSITAQGQPEGRSDTEHRLAGKSAEDEMGHFMAMARDKIEKVKSYPRWARERGFEGMVGVRFVITPDGMVDEIKIVRPCHCEALNRAACDSIKRAAPFGPRPPSFEGKRIAMEVDIGFRLE